MPRIGCTKSWADSRDFDESVVEERYRRLTSSIDKIQIPVDPIASIHIDALVARRIASHSRVGGKVTGNFFFSSSPRARRTPRPFSATLLPRGGRKPRPRGDRRSLTKTSIYEHSDEDGGEGGGLETSVYFSCTGDVLARRKGRQETRL